MPFPETTRLTATHQPQNLRAVLGLPGHRWYLTVFNESLLSRLFLADAEDAPDPSTDPPAFPVLPCGSGDVTVEARGATWFWSEDGSEITFLVGVRP